MCYPSQPPHTLNLVQYLICLHFILSTFEYLYIGLKYKVKLKSKSEHTVDLHDMQLKISAFFQMSLVNVVSLRSK